MDKSLAEREQAERELADAQKAFRDGTSRLRKRRQEAVTRALDAGLTKYKIAATLGVKGSTVDSIISAVERKQEGR
jgi:DNA-binding NarL/FixJ family response regulator